MASWTLYGTLVDAAGTPKSGIPVKASQMGPVDPTTGLSNVVGTTTSSTDANGYVNITLTSVPGATWVVQVSFESPVTIIDPGAGSSVNLQLLSPTYANASQQIPVGTGIVSATLNGDMMTFTLSNGVTMAPISVPSVTVANNALSAANSATTTADQALATANDASSKVNAAVASQDSATAQNINTGTNTQAALTAREQREGILIPAAVDHATVQAALNAARSLGIKVTVSGSYTTTNTLQIAGNCDLSGLTITYTGPTDAVQIGYQSVGQIGPINVRAPKVKNGNYTRGVWPVGSRGIVVRNVFRSTFYIPLIQDFERGLVLVGDGSYTMSGCAYNKFYVDSISNNLINEQLQLDNNNAPNQAFCNENKHFGGSWSHNDGHTDKTFVPGMRHIVVGNISQTSCNNNVWFGSSLETSQNFCEYVVEVFGTCNLWFACRWEYVWTGNPPTWWRNGSDNNWLIGGYQSENIIFNPTVEMGGNAPSVLGSNGSAFNTNSNGGVSFSNKAGGTTAAWTLMPANWQGQALDPSTNYSARAKQGHLGVKVSTDPNDRWNVDSNTRSMRFGSGIDTKYQSILWNPGSPNGAATANPGSLYFDYTNNVRYSKASGTGNTGWRLDGFATYATTGRPTAASAGVGGSYYDTTLNKPVWSDGANWRDATGTVV